MCAIFCLQIFKNVYNEMYLYCVYHWDISLYFILLILKVFSIIKSWSVLCLCIVWKRALFYFQFGKPLIKRIILLFLTFTKCSTVSLVPSVSSYFQRLQYLLYDTPSHLICLGLLPSSPLVYLSTLHIYAYWSNYSVKKHLNVDILMYVLLCSSLWFKKINSYTQITLLGFLSPSSEFMN